MGLLCRLFFFVFTFGSIIEVFLLTAGIFGAMSLYGYITKRDLTSVGHFAIMATFGACSSDARKPLFMNDTASLILACVGVVVFVLLTAYDTQKLKWMYQMAQTEGADGEKKEAINAL